MRKFVVALTMATIAALSVPSHAAVNTVAAGPASGAAGTYLTPTVVLAKTAPANFANFDIDSHDVVSVAKRNNQPIFKSSVAPLGTVVPINGVASLEIGEYEFYCSLHPNMRGTLDVRA